MSTLTFSFKKPREFYTNSNLLIASRVQIPFNQDAGKYSKKKSNLALKEAHLKVIFVYNMSGKWKYK